MSDPVTIQKFAMGQSVSRVEDPRLVQGLGRYSDDVNLPRQAYAVVVRSPHAHARVVAIETAAARQSPGALAVLTGAELATASATSRPMPPASAATARPRSRRRGRRWRATASATSAIRSLWWSPRARKPPRTPPTSWSSTTRPCPR